jgi:hypothetical protein
MAKPTPQLFRYVRPVLAISFVTFSFGFLFTIVWKAIPPENKEIVGLAVGFVLGQLSVVGGYYFGSSKDKSDQDQARTFADTQPEKVDTAVITADTATVNTNTTTP